MSDDKNTPLVLKTLDRGVATLTLNRPEHGNAMTQPLWDNLLEALNQCAADDAVRVIVLTGAGKAFCAGADIDRLKRWAAGGEIDLPMERPRPEIENGLALPAGFDDRYSYLAQIPKPIIAALNGPAAGSGFALAMFCDLRFATPQAKLCAAFSRLGLIGEMALPWLLARVAAPHVAADMLFSSRPMPGDEAAAVGLINRTYPQERFLDSVIDYAHGVAESTTAWSLATIKRQIWHGLMQNLDEAVDDYYPIMERSLHSEDFKHRLKAMLAAMNGKT
tara:strand:+ start:6833 stop:7663 length:831 start_codon:yes stop_codon:yes gene_type:complete